MPVPKTFDEIMVDLTPMNIDEMVMMYKTIAVAKYGDKIERAYLAFRAMLGRGTPFSLEKAGWQSFFSKQGIASIVSNDSRYGLPSNLFYLARDLSNRRNFRKKRTVPDFIPNTPKNIEPIKV